VFDVIIILHHIIASFRTTLHHTSYCINGKRIGHEVNFRQYFFNENVLRHEANFEKRNCIKLAIEGASFFTKLEKKGRCFFAEGSKMVCT
jgi:hypothetical protein